MIGIGIFHWLPLAENMFPEIETALSKIERDSTDKQHTFTMSYESDIHPEKRYSCSIANVKFTAGDGITYEIDWHTELGALHALGKINHIGFSQHITTIPVGETQNLQAVLDEGVQKFTALVSFLLIEILPIAAQNKIAVLVEGIVSRQEFEAGPISIDFVPSARQFLERYRIATFHVGNQHKESAAKLNLPFLKLNTSAQRRGPRSAFNQTITQLIAVSEKAPKFLHPSNFFFYNSNYHFDGDATVIDIDDVFFQYCALIIFSECLFLSINILKAVRDHVTPVRRELVVNLRQNTEDYFPLLTKIKKYLTYVDVKIPVIGKIKNHIQAIAGLDNSKFANRSGSTDENAYFINNVVERIADSEAFVETIDFALIVDSLKLDALSPTNLINRITLSAGRLVELYNEEEKEVDVLSNELTQVLEGSLLNESVKISARELDISRAALELDRGGKNRGNALILFSIVTSASLGLAVGGELGNIVNLILGWLGSTPRPDIAAAIVIALKLSLAGIAFSGALKYTRTFIEKRSHAYRLVIPINHSLPILALRHLTLERGRTLKVMDSNANRRVRAWNEKLGVQVFSDVNDYANDGDFDDKVEFLITIDYEKRGFIYYVMLEAEAGISGFRTRPLVKQIINLLEQSLMKDADYASEKASSETALYVDALSQLGVFLDDNLKGLNKILTTNVSTLVREFETSLDVPTRTSMSIEERQTLNDIIKRYSEYLSALERLEKDPSTAVLIGQHNIQQKKAIVAQFGGQYFKRIQ